MNSCSIRQAWGRTHLGTWLGESGVLRTRQPLARNRYRLVAHFSQHRSHVLGKVVIDLEGEQVIGHYAWPGTRGMTRSRARSAAYAIAAWMSSGRNVG